MWIRLRPLPGIPEVIVAQTVPEQRDSRHYQHHGLGQRSAHTTLTTVELLNVLIVTSVWTCPGLGCPQGLDFSCWWTWSASSRSRMWSSSVTVASHSVHLSLQSFWGQRRASRRTHLPRPLWTSSQRAKFPPEVTLTSSCSQSFKEWRAKELRKFKIWNGQAVSALTAKHFPFYVIFRGCIVIYRKHQRSNEHRELSLLAYLSQLQSPDPGPVRPLHSLTPYQVHENQDPTLSVSQAATNDYFHKFHKIFQFIKCHKCVKNAFIISQVTYFVQNPKTLCWLSKLCLRL